MNVNNNSNGGDAAEAYDPFVPEVIGKNDTMTNNVTATAPRKRKSRFSDRAPDDVVEKKNQNVVTETTTNYPNEADKNSVQYPPAPAEGNVNCDYGYQNQSNSTQQDQGNYYPYYPPAESSVSNNSYYQGTEETVNQQPNETGAWYNNGAIPDQSMYYQGPDGQQYYYAGDQVYADGMGGAYAMDGQYYYPTEGAAEGQGQAYASGPEGSQGQTSHAMSSPHRRRVEKPGFSSPDLSSPGGSRSGRGGVDREERRSRISASAMTEEDKVRKRRTFSILCVFVG